MAIHGGNIEEIGRQYNMNPEEILDFSANINPLGISEAVKESMVAALDKVERYPDITYYELKKALGNFENICEENIFLGNGAAEVIFNIARALKPKKVMLPAPTFSEYEEAVRSIDGEIKYYYLKEENQFTFEEDFINEIKEDVDLVFLCNPNNPTGALTKKEFIKKVLDRGLISNTVVVLDESFLDFMEDKDNYTSKYLLNKYENLIIVKSLTKFFAMAGIRIGFGMCSNKELIDKINKVSVPWAVNIVASEGICQGLKEKEYIKDTVEYVKGQKEYLYNELKEIKLIKVFKPSVNFVMFKILVNIDLKKELLSKGILIRSCSNYEGLDNRYYRVAVRTEEENKILISEIRTIFIDKEI